MRASALLSLVALLRAIAPAGAGGQDGASGEGRLYTLATDSRFEVRTGTAGLLGGLADRHIVRAGTFTGSVCYAPDDVALSWVRVEVPVDSLRVDTDVDEDDRASIRESMLSETLRAESFATVRFRSTRVRPTERGVELEGDLALAGEIRPVTVDLDLETVGAGLWAWGRFEVLQTDFGIEPYSTALGMVQVSDRVTFVIEARARSAVDEEGNVRSCSEHPLVARGRDPQKLTW